METRSPSVAPRHALRRRRRQRAAPCSAARPPPRRLRLPLL